MSNIIRNIGPVNYANAVATYAADLPAASAALASIATAAPIGIDRATREHTLRIARDCFVLRGGDANTARVFYRLGLRSAGFDA